MNGRNCELVWGWCHCKFCRTQSGGVFVCWIYLVTLI